MYKLQYFQEDNQEIVLEFMQKYSFCDTYKRSDDDSKVIDEEMEKRITL